VALLMPSLILLSRTRLYTAVRTTIATAVTALRPLVPDRIADTLGERTA
jgi:hypothetical protein